MNRPPIILTIMQTGARANGGVQSIGEVMRRLTRYRAVVLTNVDSEFTQAWRREGIEVHVEPARMTATLFRKPFEFLATQLRYYRRLRKLIAASRAEIVHANDPLALQLSLSAARRAGARLVFNLRGTVPPERRAPRLKYAFFFSAVDHVLYLSHDMARRWQAVAPNATRACSVTYSIVDTERFRASPIETGRDPVVLVSGLFRELKGQLGFIRHVLPTLSRNGVKVWFAGDFNPQGVPYCAACAEAAEPYGEAVRFLGYRDDMPELMSRARVIAVPSAHEGLVRAMIEGMSCARPVVSFDVCSAREILEEEGQGAGTVVERGDFAAMTKAILTYCRDEVAATDAGEKGRRTAERLFTGDEVVDRYERVYDMLKAAA